MNSANPKYPKILGHQYKKGGPTLFKVHYANGTVVKMTEIEMDRDLQFKLVVYKNERTGQNWNGQSTTCRIRKILGHRYFNGVLYYFVAWGEPWTNQLWNSEEKEDDMVDTPMLRHYKAKKGL